MRVRVFYHDKCFDGACSAALFSRFYRERIRSDVDFVYSGLLHRAGALFDEKQFDGDENAIVDFKYSSSPKITWWFDHHESAFLSPADAAHFEQDQSNRKFYDPAFKSCTSFIAMIAEERFGFDPRPVAELVHWTDIVDGAMYEDAKSAVEMKAPAMKLTMAIESSSDRDFVKKLIPLLAYHPLAAILEEPFVAAVLPPLLERHQRSIEILRQRAEEKDGTIFFDITDLELEGYNKFIPVLPASRFGLQRRPQQELIPGESFGRVEPLVETPSPPSISPRSANAMAAAATPASGRSRSMSLRVTPPAKPRPRSSRNCAPAFASKFDGFRQRPMSRHPSLPNPRSRTHQRRAHGRYR